MKDINAIRTFLRTILGDSSIELFDRHMEEFACCVKTWALSDMKSTHAEVKDRFKNVSYGILSESVKLFLSEKFSKEDGSLSVEITDTEIYDEHHKKIPAIMALRDRQEEIIEFMVNSAMKDFESGRKLAKVIINRATKFESDKLDKLETPKKSRVPAEAIEVEIMRLEKRLSSLTPEEGERLSELYEVLGACVGSL
jgi:hypothetical protein